MNAKSKKYICQSSKINTTITGSSGEMALILAAESGKWDIIEILIDHGADVNAMRKKYVCQSFKINTTMTGSSGELVLILAVERGKWDIIDILVDHGADLNIKGENYIQDNFRNLKPSLQIPLVKLLSLRQSKAN